MSELSKSAMPDATKEKPKHMNQYCIGSETFNKQKMIPKLFQESLRILARQDQDKSVLPSARV